MARVVFENVGKTYAGGTRAAVKGFSLEVRDGEFLVLVGPSGCGKSTTLRMVAGLETPTEGKLFIGEREVTTLPPKDRDIAMVFQNYALYPHMTVKENMSFALKLRKFPRAEIERRVAAAAESLGLVEYLGRLPKQLSGGQRQRVALGRAIVREPSVFLFDEPLSNLDAKMRVEMRAEIIRLHRELKTTMIYVTHDQTEAMTMGERIVVMDGGVIQQTAAPLELYENPANRFVASFIGTPPMNLFPGEWFGKKGVSVGLRPEHITIDEPAAAARWGHRALPDGDAARWGHRALPDAVVDYVEVLGSESLVHLKKDGFEFIVRTPGFASFAHGERVALAADMNKAREFDL